MHRLHAEKGKLPCAGLSVAMTKLIPILKLAKLQSDISIHIILQHGIDIRCIQSFREVRLC